KRQHRVAYFYHGRRNIRGLRVKPNWSVPFQECVKSTGQFVSRPIQFCHTSPSVSVLCNCPAARRYTSSADTTTEKETPSVSKCFWPQRTLSASLVRSFRRSLVLLVSRTRYSVSSLCLTMAQSGLYLPTGVSISNQPGSFTNRRMSSRSSRRLANSLSTSDS